MTRHLSIYSLSSFLIFHFQCIRPKCNCMSNFDLTFCPQILQLVGFPVLFPVCVFWTCKNTLSSIPFLKQILQQNSGFFFDPICNWTPVLNQDSWSSVCVSRQSKSGCRSGINKVCLFVVFKAGLTVFLSRVPGMKHWVSKVQYFYNRHFLIVQHCERSWFRKKMNSTQRQLQT